MATLAGSDPAAPRQRGRRLVQYGLLFLGCLLFLDALVGEKGLVENLKARQQFQATERSLARLRDENARLSKEVELLRKDPETIEGIARRELGLMKPGEKLFIVKDAEPAAP
jgi:cell division protein FtsB